MGSWNGHELDNLIISAPRLTLRPWSARDAAAIQTGMQDAAMREFLPIPAPYTEASAREFLAGAAAARTAGTALESAVVERTSGEIVGSAALRLPARGYGGEVGYAVYPAFRGRGYAGEAAAALAEWGFAHGLRRVRLRAAVGNLASIRTALAAGFAFEGVSRNDIITGSGVVDGAVFARVPGDRAAHIPAAFAPLPPAGLDDGVVQVRPLVAADAEALLDEATDAASVRWNLSGQKPALANTRRAAERAALDWLVGPQASAAIVDTASGTVAGSLSLRLSGPAGVGEFGYGLRPAWRGRGYTSRALRLMAQWALDAGFHRLEIGADIANIASHRVALGAGFADDGVRTARLAYRGSSAPADERRFVLLRAAG